jgi:hypothetical protein
MRKVRLLPLLLLLLGGCKPSAPSAPPSSKSESPSSAAAPEASPAPAAAEPAATRDAFLMLPRFAEGVGLDDIQMALASVPAAKFQYVRQDNLQKGTPGYFGIMVRYNTAKVDVGDIAKALSALGGDKSQAVAMLSLSELTEISEADFAALKKELAKAKGIDWKLSGRRGIALDEAGEAKYAEILAGYKKAGIWLNALADD